MNKIKKLVEELKKEVKKETGVIPGITINIHQNSKNERKMSLIEANRQFENLREKLGLRRWKFNFYEDHSSITNDVMDDISLTIYFNDRRDELENRQSDAGEAMQESEVPEMVTIK